MKFKVTRQLESNDCGYACVKMLADFFYKDTSINELKRICPKSKQGLSFDDLCYCLDELGIDSYATNLSITQLGSCPLPTILRWENDHFVVLHGRRKKNKKTIFYIADPSFGRVQVADNEISSYWKSGCILTEANSMKSTSKDSARFNMNNWTQLFKAYFPYKVRILVAFLLLLLGTVVNWNIPVLFQKITDLGIVKSDFSVVVQFAILQAVFFLSYLIVENVSNLILTKINLDISLDYLARLLNKYTKLPIDFFEANLKTDLTQRLGDQGRVQNFISYKILDIVYYSLNVIVFSILIVRYSVILFFVFLTLSTLSLLWTTRFLRKRSFLDYSRFANQSKSRNIVLELINGMSEIKINNAQEYNLKKWSLFQSEINKIALRSLYLNYTQLAGSNIIDKIRDIFIIILTSHLIIRGTYSIGVLMTIMYIMGQLSGAMNRIYFFIRDYQDAHISLSRLNEIYSKDEEPIHSKSPNPGNIAIQNMSFKYPGRQNTDVLKEMSFEIPFGQTTAIVGNSGCGKTTLAKLLLGLYTPTSGDILINNSSVSNLNLDEWRSKCGAVMQDGYIFSDTLANNIAMQDENVDLDRIELVCNLSCLIELVSKLPNGIHTIIGHEGTKLSGGEKQRILIARALYKNPSLLIFDEATSHLDAQNESKVMLNMKRHMCGKTTVIIAHRLSTIIEADNIIFIENGRVLEKGNHTDLLQLRGKYYSLVREQMSVV